MIPKLRFPEFKDEWQEKSLGDVSDFCSYGLNSAAKKFDGRNKYIRITDINEESREFSKNNLTSPSIINDKYLLDDDDIIFARTGASVGKTYLYNKNDGKVYFAGFLIKFSIKYANPYFIFLHTLQPKYENWVKIMSARSGQPGINADEYKTFKVVLPSKKEQEKIADFLRGGDERMVLLEKKADAMREYKKGVMSAIFSGKLRFKDENGNSYPDWEERRLGDIIIKNSQKNKNNEINFIQSVSNIYGFVAQEDLFEDRIVASDNLRNYYVIKRGTFAYNPSRIDVGSLAYKSDKNTSVVSPLYVSFRADNRFLVDGFLFAWFKSNDFQRQMHNSFEGSVRNTLNYFALSGMKIKLPSLIEQQKIADFLSAIDRKIELEQIRLDRTKDFKKGLLQRMFV